MKLEKLSVVNFRNIAEEQIEFNKNVNIIFGDNGQGKTSLLEAIYFLAITRSFRAKTDKVALRHTAEYFDIRAKFLADENYALTLRIYFSSKEGKHVFINENQTDKFSKIIGTIPIILLSLEDINLIYGIPTGRRRFIDILLSQVSPVYLRTLQSYKRALLNRNKLLSLINEKKEKSDSLMPWSEQIVTLGTEIIIRRMELIRFFNEEISQYYRNISEQNEEISLKYRSNVLNTDQRKSEKDQIYREFTDQLKQNEESDVQKKSTQVGPHRDDVDFFKNDYLIKSFGSQGENKTLLIALKFVESIYLKKKMKENPIFLMDDIFGELDEYRIARLMEFLSAMGQTFITTTVRNKFNNSALSSINYLEMKNGKVVQ